jgi:tetratricopeptide (TPR) repeat protein
MFLSQHYRRSPTNTLLVAPVMALLLALHAASVCANDTEFRKLQQYSEQAELQNNLTLAIALNHKLLEIKSKDVETMTTLSGLYGKAGNFEQELAWAHLALKHQPGHFPALINQGNALAGTGKTQAAQESYRKAQRIDPSSPIPAYSMGVLAQNNNQQSTALLHFQTALKINPHFEDALFNLAVAYANLKLYPEAIKTLNCLLKQNPSAIDALYMRTDIQERFMNSAPPTRERY